MSYPGTLWTKHLWLHVLILLLICCTYGATVCSKQCRRCLGDRCEACIAGYYGASCERCSPRCKFRLCIPGRCNDGCVQGWYGDYCDKPCPNCDRGCDSHGTCIPEKKEKSDKLPDLGKKILYGFFCFAGLGVAMTIIVFVADKKYPYSRFRVISCFSRKKKPVDVYVEDQSSEDMVWKLAPGSKHSPSDYVCKYPGESRIEPSNSGVTWIPEPDRRSFLFPKPEVRVVVSPPSPSDPDQTGLVPQTDLPGVDKKIIRNKKRKKKHSLLCNL